MSIQSLITKLFEKKGVKSIEDLSIDEKTEYDRWQSILDGNEITVEKIRQFCKKQIEIIENKYASGDNTDKQDIFLKASLHIYLNLLKLIDSPEIDRVNLEKYLTNLLNS